MRLSMSFSGWPKYSTEHSDSPITSSARIHSQRSDGCIGATAWRSRGNASRLVASSSRPNGSRPLGMLITSAGRHSSASAAPRSARDWRENAETAWRGAIGWDIKEGRPWGGGGRR
ncbi:hypothetical protein NB689_003467 [Xanthomonas sacchari]|nr:hypothetical protein [Xanthomonas sacchari]